MQKNLKYIHSLFFELRTQAIQYHDPKSPTGQFLTKPLQKRMRYKKRMRSLKRKRTLKRIRTIKRMCYEKRMRQ